MTIEQQYEQVRNAVRSVDRVFTKVGLTFGERLDLLLIIANLEARRTTRPTVEEL